MRSLNAVIDWPVDHVAAAVIRPDGAVVTVGDQDRRYRLASISKPLTAWAILIGVEEGVIRLDDPTPGAQPGCTYRHLLAHAVGYPFEGPDPIAPPERTRMYSNTGFELAVTAFRDASGIEFAEYLREAVLEPLGMTVTKLEGSPAHDVVGSCGDLVRFAAELREPILLHPDTAAEGTRTQYPALSGIVPGVGRFTPCPWGIGVEIAGDKTPHWTGRSRSARTFGHFGGAGTMMWVDPDAGCALVALTDRPFDDWAEDAVRSWAALSDAVLAEASENPW